MGILTTPFTIPPDLALHSLTTTTGNITSLNGRVVTPSLVFPPTVLFEVNGVINIDHNLGDEFTIVVNGGNITGITFSNLHTGYLRLRFNSDEAALTRTVVGWPAAVKSWAGAIPPGTFGLPPLYSGPWVEIDLWCSDGAQLFATNVTSPDILSKYPLPFPNAPAAVVLNTGVAYHNISARTQDVYVTYTSGVGLSMTANVAIAVVSPGAGALAETLPAIVAVAYVTQRRYTLPPGMWLRVDVTNATMTAYTVAI